MNKPLEPLESECTLVGDMSKWEREKWNIIERRKGSMSLHKVCKYYCLYRHKQKEKEKT